MRDVDTPPDAGFPLLDSNDAEIQRDFIARFRGLHGELYDSDPDWVTHEIITGLTLCPALLIRSPRDVLRFLELRLVIVPKMLPGDFRRVVMARVLRETEEWSATKRLDFIYRHVVDHPAATNVPDFGPW